MYPNTSAEKTYHDNAWVYQGGDPTYEAIPNLDNWADVVHAYDSIKPVVSKKHPIRENLRPIGQRRRKWEKIIRLEDIGGITGISYHVEDDNGGSALIWEKRKWETHGKEEEDTYLTIYNVLS